MHNSVDICQANLESLIFRERKAYILKEQTTRKVKQEVIYLGLDVDTEFQDVLATVPWNGELPQLFTLTTQVRNVKEDTGRIYLHPDMRRVHKRYHRHPFQTTEFIGFDYLRDCGLDVAVRHKDPDSKCAMFEFALYGHFLTAEISRIFNGEMLEHILKLLANPNGQENIQLKRRLLCQTEIYTDKGVRRYDYVNLPWIMRLEGVDYQVRLSLHDSCAVHGNAGYQNVCNNVGLKLEHKDNFTKTEKAQMLQMFIERPEDFDNYALGDLYVSTALEKYNDQMKTIWETLEISHNYKPPALTIGSTMSAILTAILRKHLPEAQGMQDYKQTLLLQSLMSCACSAKFSGMHNNTGRLLSRVQGGRIRNNRPTDVRTTNIVVDIDIAGCYGDGLRVQQYPLGTPLVLNYPLNAATNSYISLRQFLKVYRSDLVAGLWMGRVTGSVKYAQDFLPSWLPPSKITTIVKDSDSADLEPVPDGQTRIYKYEIQNAPITHDFIQWLENVASPRQAKDMLDNLRVVCAVFYPLSERKNTVAEVIEARSNHIGRNTTRIKHEEGTLTKVTTEQDCHAWTSVDLGEECATKLLQERKKHPKKTPLNELYKLLINTVYGVIVSPYFECGNVIVGTNITARARALAWYMEKGFCGFMTITDGCTFEVERVPVLVNAQKRTLNGENVIDMYAKHRNFTTTYKLRSLPGIDVEEIKRLVQAKEDSTAKALIDVAAFKHLQTLFPNVDVLHQRTTRVDGSERIGQYEFETKSINIHGASFHSVSNYMLKTETQDTLILTDEEVEAQKKTVAMRGYESGGIQYFTMDGQEQFVEIVNNQNAAMTFLNKLFHNPEAVARQLPYISKGILKPAEYAQRYENYYTHSQLMPGTTMIKPRLLKECGLSQFTFLSHEQYISWKKEETALKAKYLQAYEMFYINPDGSLNYKRMIEDLNERITRGDMQYRTPQQVKKMKRFNPEHPHKKTLQKLKDEIIKQTHSEPSLAHDDIVLQSTPISFFTSVFNDEPYDEEPYGDLSNYANLRGEDYDVDADEHWDDDYIDEDDMYDD